MESLIFGLVLVNQAEIKMQIAGWFGNLHISFLCTSMIGVLLLPPLNKISSYVQCTLLYDPSVP